MAMLEFGVGRCCWPLVWLECMFWSNIVDGFGFTYLDLFSIVSFRGKYDIELLMLAHAFLGMRGI